MVETVAPNQALMRKVVAKAQTVSPASFHAGLVLSSPINSHHRVTFDGVEVETDKRQGQYLVRPRKARVGR